MRMRQYNVISKDGTINPFSNKVIIIDDELLIIVVKKWDCAPKNTINKNQRIKSLIPSSSKKE